MEKNLAEMEGSVSNYKNLVKRKQQLDQRTKLFYGLGNKNQIFPDMDRIQKLAPLNNVSNKNKRNVKFATEDDSDEYTNISD